MRVPGRKRHIVADTLSQLPAVAKTAADVGAGTPCLCFCGCGRTTGTVLLVGRMMGRKTVASGGFLLFGHRFHSACDHRGRRRPGTRQVGIDPGRGQRRQ